MQSLGNDFIIIDATEKNDLQIIQNRRIGYICDRKYGIGCDQLIIFKILDKQKVVVKIYNNDGSTAYNCGNGMRCLMWLIYILSCKKVIQVTAILEKNRELSLRFSKEIDAKQGIVRGEIGKYLVNPIKYYEFDGYYVDVGNEHFVVFVDELQSLDEQIAMQISKRNNTFQNGINVSFVKIEESEAIVRVWERGVGETNACGSAAAAVYIALTKKSYVINKVTFLKSETSLHVEHDESVKKLYVTGPANFVYEGIIEF